MLEKCYYEMLEISFSIIVFHFSDINECTTGTADCDINSSCFNTDGSYQCLCKDGYTRDGKSCQGLNRLYEPWERTVFDIKLKDML